MDDLMFKKLSTPFAPSKVSWRVGRKKKDNPLQGTALCYIDARDVMARLDEVCGPAGWMDSYTETARGRLLCTISIRVNDEWISKSDGAGDTQVEGEKGAISDAFKRAAVKWGVGRYLYDIEAQWVDLDKWGGILPTSRQKLEKALPGSRIPDIERHDMPKTDGAPSPHIPVPLAGTEPDWKTWAQVLVPEAIKAATDAAQIDAIVKENGPALDNLKAVSPKAYDSLMRMAKTYMEALVQRAA